MSITIETRDGKDWVVHSDIDWARPATPDESALWAHKDARIAELEKELNIARNEVSDLRAFIDGIKRHVTAAAQMFGLSS